MPSSPYLPATDSVEATPPQLRFMMALGYALSRYGAPAHRLEEVIESMAKRLGLEAQVFSVPTALMTGLGSLGHQRMSMVRVVSAEIDLGKLVDLDHLVERVHRGEVTPEAGLERLTQIERQPRRLPREVTVMAHGLVSATAASFLGGGLREVACGALIGLGIGALSLVMQRLPEGPRIFEMTSAAVAALVSLLACRWVGVSPFVAMLAGLIILLPGLTLTLGMSELATRNLVSGAARLTAAAVAFLQLILGVAAGYRLDAVWFGALPEPASAITLPPGTEIVALTASTLGLVVLFRAPLRSAWALFGACCLSFYGARLGTQVLGSELGVMVGAFAVGLAGNIYARLGRGPSVLLVVPGILLLVPGSIGFRSLAQLLANDPLSSVNTAFAMVLGAVGIVGGLLLANVVVSPRRAL